MRQIGIGSVSLVVAAGTLFAQPSPQGGWRRFQDSPQSSAQQPLPAPQQQTINPPAQITIPAGTWLTIRVDQPLSSDHNHQGDSFTATLEQPLVAQGFVVARRGQTLAGRVVEALKAGRIKGTSQLSIELGEMTLVDGQRVPLRTELVQYSGPTSVGRDATAIGATTGVGAAIGAAADGGFGAGMGAIAGAGASIIGVLVTRGEPTVITPESTLTFKTTDPFTISTTGAPQAFQPVQQQDYTPAPSQQQPRLQRRVAAGPPPAYYPPAPYPVAPYAVAPYPYYAPYYWGPGFGASVVIVGHHHH
jgi:hypothetical protein